MAALVGAAAGITVGAAAGVATSAAGALGSVGCLVVKELSSQAFALTLSHLSDVLTYLTRKSDDVTKLVCEELAKTVPTAKLKIIQCVLFDFEWLRDESKTMDALCERLTELAQSIHFNVQQIGYSIEAFNQLYFKSWRTLDVSMHLQIIKQDVKELNETFELVKLLLPSCITLSENSHIQNLRRIHRSKTKPPQLIDTNTTSSPSTALVLCQ